MISQLCGCIYFENFQVGDFVDCLLGGITWKQM